jgi:hypothetical protein
MSSRATSKHQSQGWPTLRESNREGQSHPVERQTTQSIDWYAPGQSRTVEINGVQVTVRFVGRKGRRARIAIEGPLFRTSDFGSRLQFPKPSAERRSNDD